MTESKRKRKDELWCISPVPRCPQCDSENFWYDNEHENKWGEFRDAHCLDCGYWWCEIIGDVDDD